MAAQQDAIEVVLSAGFQAAGTTPTERVKFPVSTGHGLGFKGATFGGRPRFSKGDRRVTVGKITTNFYEIGVTGQPTNFICLRTRDLDAIREQAR